MRNNTSQHPELTETCNLDSVFVLQLRDCRYFDSIQSQAKNNIMPLLKCVIEKGDVESLKVIIELGFKISANQLKEVSAIAMDTLPWR